MTDEARNIVKALAKRLALESCPQHFTAAEERGVAAEIEAAFTQAAEEIVNGSAELERAA